MKKRKREYLKVITIAKDIRLGTVFYIIIFSLCFKSNFQKQKHDN